MSKLTNEDIISLLRDYETASADVIVRKYKVSRASIYGYVAQAKKHGLVISKPRGAKRFDWKTIVASLQ